MRTKQKLLLEDLSPGKLTGKRVRWRARMITDPEDRQPFGDPVFVDEPSGYLARHTAAREFTRLRRGATVDPLCVDVVLDHESNGAG